MILDLQTLYDQLAGLTYDSIQGIIIGVLISMVFTFDQHNQVRWTFAEGFSPPVRTSVIVISFVLIFIAWHFITQQIQEPLTKYLASLSYRLIPATISGLSFASFWLTKITLGRVWHNRVTIITLIVSIVTVIITGLLIYYYPPNG